MSILDHFLARADQEPNAAVAPDEPLTHVIDLEEVDDGIWQYDDRRVGDRVALRLWTGEVLWAVAQE